MKQVLLHARQILRGTSLEAQEQYQKVEEEIGTAVASLRTVEECTSHMRRIIGQSTSLRNWSHDEFQPLTGSVQMTSSAYLNSMQNY